MSQFNTFIDDYLNGSATISEVDNYIDYWHSSSSELTLAEFLGLQEFEYEVWVRDPNCLADILWTKRNSLPD